MNTASTYCDGPGDHCARCGAPLVAPNQVCRGPEDALDEPAELDVVPTRRDWRLLLRAAEKSCVYHAQRIARRSSLQGGADVRNLERLRRLIPALARAAGVPERTE